MSAVSVNTKKNRIYITILDTNRKELEITVMKIEIAALSLNSKFTCVTDFRFAGNLLLGNRDLLARCQKILVEMGLGKVVRLVTQHQIESSRFKILDIVGSGYEIDYATDIKAADRILDNYQREIAHIFKQSSRGGPKFKIIDKSGWEHEEKFVAFKDALQRLKHVRQSGRNDAIVVSK
jgi:hypothetical protein